jgi:hypothetical protein
VNVITYGLRKHLGLPLPQPIAFNLQLVDVSFNKPSQIIPNIKIRIRGIPYIVTFMIMNNKTIDLTYSMLL